MDIFTIEGNEKRDYVVKKFGNSNGHIILPKGMIGKTIKVVFVDAIEKD